MITLGTKNYIGTIDLFEDKCIVYDNRRVLDILNLYVIAVTIKGDESQETNNE